MKDNDKFYCYSFKLHCFILAFGEKCVISKVNSNSKKRYWIFNKSKRLDKIIEKYNELKNKI